MKEIVVIVDPQIDFTTGILGNAECTAVMKNIANVIIEFDGDEMFLTKDTHTKNYLETQEGKKLPFIHTIEGTEGWEFHKDIIDALTNRKHEYPITIICKPTFGSTELVEQLQKRFSQNEKFKIKFCGVCTGICVISNAILVKAFFPEAEISVDASCCACVTLESHKTALEAMKMCQIDIINE